MNFTKMHGAGNDYVYVNCFEEKLNCDLSDLAIKVSDRNFGIGSDGLILIEPSSVSPAKMRMFNADGSEAEMCGNGLRCVAKFVYEHGIHSEPEFDLETGCGLKRVQLNVDGSRVESVTINMGQPILEAKQIPSRFQESPVVNQKIEVLGREFLVTSLSMGNPHCVILVDELNDDLVKGFGSEIEKHEQFPAKTNVEFVEVISKTHLRQRTWERGAGETLACGSGASAVCVAGVLTRRTERKVKISLSGGDLELDWRESDNSVYKTGPAVEVYSGTWLLS